MAAALEAVELPPGARLVAGSPTMRRALGRLARVARSDTSVLITGETGTGKERAARFVHAMSSRSGGPLVPMNCGAIPESLLEAELFGHEQGAFTDARQARGGLLAAASGGTLFLDEIGDMPPSMQTKLLRAIETRCRRPIGGAHELPFDCRIVAATHRDLRTRMASGQFREDFFYRLAVFEVNLPPLRKRVEDIPVLAQEFLADVAARTGRPIEGFAADTLWFLERYPWPGNIRELRNAVEHAAVLTDRGLVRSRHLPTYVTGGLGRRPKRASQPERSDGATPSLASVEYATIIRAIDESGGNVAVAATRLGISRRTIYRKVNAVRLRAARKRASEEDAGSDPR